MADCIFHKKNLIILLFCSLILICSGCGNSDEKIPDTSSIKVNLITYRFDKDFYALDTNNIGKGLIDLQAKYPDFLNYYLDTLMDYHIHGDFSDTNKTLTDSLKPFITFKDFVQLRDTILKYYPDSKETDAELVKGFKLLKYYFPDYSIPRIFYLDMELRNFPVFPIDTSTLCIGLDWFLGPQFPHYASVGVPGYMGGHLTKSYLPVSVFSALYLSRHPLITDDNTLLELILQKGREMVFIHKILPNTSETVLFGFTQKQIDWCNANEALIYNFFIHQKLLYSKDPHNTLQYIHDGPFAAGLESVTDQEKNSPGNIGTWLGYKIVKNYMAIHPDISLKELINSKIDAPKFLNDAKYRPK